MPSPVSGYTSYYFLHIFLLQLSNLISVHASALALTTCLKPKSSEQPSSQIKTVSTVLNSDVYKYIFTMESLGDVLTLHFFSDKTNCITYMQDTKIKASRVSNPRSAAHEAVHQTTSMQSFFLKKSANNSANCITETTALKDIYFSHLTSRR
jgi:hypothetical protein